MRNTATDMANAAHPVMIDSLTYEELRNLIGAAAAAQEITLAEEVFIPEANVFLCSCRGKRFNVKFDMDYGVSIEAVDSFSSEELASIRRMLEDFASRGLRFRP